MNKNYHFFSVTWGSTGGGGGGGGSPTWEKFPHFPVFFGGGASLSDFFGKKYFKQIEICNKSYEICDKL